MSLMSEIDVLTAAKVGSLRALYARIDVGAFPPPLVIFGGGRYWDDAEVRRSIEIIRAPGPDEPLKRENPKREKPQPLARTRERKDDPSTETRESE